jgi:deoxyxylulose-5-phosphate synthase
MKYIGPIEGHRFDYLIETFQNIRKLKGPILVHVLTRKGKGYPPAEENAAHFHSVSPFDLETGKAVLRDYINATMGFGKLAHAMRRSPKSIMRMLGPNGNPQANNLVEIVAYLQEKEGVRLHVKAARAS